MKIKKCCWIIFGVILLSACGTLKDNESDKIEEQEVEANIDNEKEEKQEIILPRVEISNKQYESLKVLNDNYIAYKENEKYGVIDYGENVILQPEYDYIDSISDEGDFIAGVNSEIGYEYKLYDKSLNIIFDNQEYKDYMAISYNEEILELIDYDKEEKIYVSLSNDIEKKLVLNNQNVGGYIASSSYDNDYIVIVSDTYTEEGFPNLVSLEGELTYLYHDDKMIYTYIGCAVDDNGWILCYEIDKNNLGDYNNGFYNIKSNTFCNIPDEMKYIIPIKNSNQIYYAAYNNICLMKENEESDKIYAYDLIGQRILNEKAYGEIELLDYSKEKILIYDLDKEKWGYAKTDFSECGKLYDDATSYNLAGYALVNIDGKEYVIDKDDNIVSQEIEGNEAFLQNEIFVVSNNGKYRFLQIK